MQHGIILGAPTIQGQIDTAVRAERAGFDAGWTIDFCNAHGLVRLAAVATATEKVQLGTAIAYAFMRTPLLAATAAMDIDEISGGRMILGLGSGTGIAVEPGDSLQVHASQSVNSPVGLRFVFSGYIP